MKELKIIQNELKCPKGNFNSFGKYKYRSAEDILEALKPILFKHDCLMVVKDEILELNDMLIIKSIATIAKDGEEISAVGFAGIDINLKGMSIPQTFGAASSYARKYALNGLFLIDETESDPDSRNNEKPSSEPKNELPWLNKATESFNKVKTALDSGTATMDDVRKKFKVSKEVELLLTTKN